MDNTIIGRQNSKRDYKIITGTFWWNIVKFLYLITPIFLFLPYVRFNNIAGKKGYVISAFHILIGTHGLGNQFESNKINPFYLVVITVILMLTALVLVFVFKRNKPSFLAVLISIGIIILTYLGASMCTWVVKSGWKLMVGVQLQIMIQLVIIISTIVAIVLSRVNPKTGLFQSHMALFSMLLPGIIYLLVFAYLPMPGILLAFKRYRVFSNNVLENFFKSEWVGLDNFNYLFSSPDVVMITRNTVLYNIAFMILGLIASVSLAIIISEIPNRKLAKIYQTTYFLPYFLSWMVVAYLAFALFNYDLGVLNKVLRKFGIEPIDWYMEPKYWPFIFVFAHLWKYTGHGSIVYIATIAGFDTELYEAAAIDGANKWQQTIYLTIPMLIPMMTLLTILSVGRIFNADLGMFLSLPMGSGPLRNVSNVIDLYVYNSLRGGTNIGFPAAAAFYQSIVGFILIIITNAIVRKINPDNALF